MADATDTFIEVCIVDGSELFESYDADENGVFTYFVCHADHTYKAAYDGMRWSPIDQHDYDEDVVR